MCVILVIFDCFLFEKDLIDPIYSVRGFRWYSSMAKMYIEMKRFGFVVWRANEVDSCVGPFNVIVYAICTSGKNAYVFHTRGSQLIEQRVSKLSPSKKCPKREKPKMKICPKRGKPKTRKAQNENMPKTRKAQNQNMPKTRKAQTKKNQIIKSPKQNP